MKSIFNFQYTATCKHVKTSKYLFLFLFFIIIFFIAALKQVTELKFSA